MRIEESRALFCHAERAWRDIEHKYLRRTSANGTMKMKISSVDRKKRTLYTFLHGVKPIVFKGLEGRATFYYPNWWSDAPMAVYTFLESYDFTGKTLIPFNTSVSGGFGRSLSGIEESAAGAEILEGFTVTSDQVEGAQEDVSAWISGLGLESGGAE